MNNTRDPLTDDWAYDRAEHESEVLDWRAARLHRLTAPDSWLSLIGRVALDAGPHSVGSAETCDIVLPKDKSPEVIGSLERDGSLVRFTSNGAAALSLQASGTMNLVAVVPNVPTVVRTDRDGTPDKLVVGTITLEITEHASGMFVRVRDPESPTRRDFVGIDHYPIDPKWRVVARLERYEPHKVVELAYEAGSTQRYTSPGAAAFEIDGVTYRVDAVFDGERPRLYLVFWDLTARDTTYGAGRFLYAPLPHGDRVLLDFNQAFSPPCAFTPYAACPLAPTQNRLNTRIEAGEKRPH